MRYRSQDVQVEGGSLRVGVWEPEDVSSGGGADQVPTVLAIHGITANHRCWVPLARALPSYRVVAPDLRGRGRSSQLPGPYGMATHAQDLIAILDALQITAPVPVLGHSMGGFVAVSTAARYPDRVSSLGLIDGGLPLVPPPGVDPDQLVQAILGPAAQRLSMTFADREAYRDFWRQHPAFEEWTEVVQDYIDYDLVGTEPQLHASTSYEAVAADSADLVGSDSFLADLDAVRQPIRWVVAPRGLMNETPGLYPPVVVEQMAQRYPVQVAWVADLNHYTVVLAEEGIAACLPTIEAVLHG